MRLDEVIDGRAWVLDDALPLGLCGSLIQMAEDLGFDEAPVNTVGGERRMEELRNNDRAMLDDVDAAAGLFERLRPALPAHPGFEVVGLNERLRFYRYGPGQFFDWHSDGRWRPDDQTWSVWTLMLYLGEPGLTGGATSFRGQGAVEAIPGRALLFDHMLIHRGDTVIAGRKYVLRSDVLVRPSVA